MAIDFTITSPAPPEAVVASIRQHAGEWRESKIPSDLRSDRVLTVEGYAEGTRYRYGYMRRWYWRGERELHVWGEVRPGKHGGSIVTVRCGTYRRSATVMMVLVALIVIAIGWRHWLTWAVGAVILSSAYAERLSDRRFSRSQNPQADYLVTRIEEAVAAASAPSAAAVTSNRDRVIGS